ncbi:MAG: DUF3574 domain-containing protein [Cyanobacteria bacterium SBLK]|nr:DUF3574 domain-containing protein [Cyanobacteria bacterium SBLK]
MLNLQSSCDFGTPDRIAIAQSLTNSPKLSSRRIGYFAISFLAAVCWLNLFTPVVFARDLELLAQESETREIWIKEELYFGRGLPDGSMVSDEQWREFVETKISPLFPDGFSILDVNGYYLHNREQAKLLIILHPNSLEAERSLTEIINNYKEEFQQESVLRVRDRVRVQF